MFSPPIVLPENRRKGVNSLDAGQLQKAEKLTSYSIEIFAVTAIVTEKIAELCLMTSVLYDFCDFIHEAQKERGSVSLYLRSHGQQFSEELESQYAVVDTRLKPLNTPVPDPDKPDDN